MNLTKQEKRMAKRAAGSLVTWNRFFRQIEHQAGLCDQTIALAILSDDSYPEFCEHETLFCSLFGRKFRERHFDVISSTVARQRGIQFEPAFNDAPIVADECYAAAFLFRPLNEPQHGIIPPPEGYFAS